MNARKELRARKKEISEEALSELIQAIGPHRQQLASELEKLSLYVGDRPNIEIADVKAIVSRNKLARAFAVAEALGDRDLPRVLRTLDEELWDMKFDKDKSEIGLLYGIISKVRAMVLMKEVVREGWLKPEREYFRFKNQFENLPAANLPSDKKFNPRALHPFVAHKALLQCGNYTSDELIRAMGLLLDCNQRLVSRNLDEALVLQQTLVEIVRGQADRLPAGGGNTKHQAPSTR
jgi:DNA polymerase III subunit delta